VLAGKWRICGLISPFGEPLSLTSPGATLRGQDRAALVAYFRYWNLLEMIAAERVEKGTLVTDFEAAYVTAPTF
jgi:hypothetical protein